MCDIRTVTSVESWDEVGERVRQARLASRMSQAELAVALGIDRTAVARVEGGQRQVSALELFRLSEVLGVPIGHFVARPPAAVVSRRRELVEDADGVTRERFRMDARLEAHARDAQWLLAHGFLTAVTGGAAVTGGTGSGGGVVSTAGLDRLGSAEQVGVAQAVALELRDRLGVGREPLGAMAEVCGRVGLHLVVVAGMEAGASLLLEPAGDTADGGVAVGVAVIGADSPPGRRRFTAAHELAHFVLQDEYATDIGVAASRDEREQRIDAFAAEFLLPREGLVAAWDRFGGLPERARLVQVAGSFRVSWSAAVRAAGEAGVIGADGVGRWRSRPPQRGELLEVLGREPVEDLVVGETSPGWRQAVIAAWRAGAVTASRVVELLHGAVTESELPDRDEPDLP